MSSKNVSMTVGNSHVPLDNLASFENINLAFTHPMRQPMEAPYVFVTQNQTSLHVTPPSNGMYYRPTPPWNGLYYPSQTPAMLLPSGIFVRIGPLFNPPELISPVGGNYQPPTLPPQIKPEGFVGRNMAKKEHLTKEICDLIYVLGQQIPYPSTSDPASTLSNVIDYIMLMKRRIQQLKSESQSTITEDHSMADSDVQSQSTITEDHSMPDSPIHGLVEMDNQTVKLSAAEASVNHIEPTMSTFPINQATDTAGIRVPLMGHQENFRFGAINPTFNPNN